MQIQLTVAPIVAGLFLCIAGPAAAAQPPASFAVEDPLATTCTKLAIKGAKVVVRNETGSKRRVRLAPREFIRGNGKAIGVKKVCGGLIVTPPQLTLPGGASRKLKLRATAARAGNFTGSLALISRKGRVSRRAVSISAKPTQAKGLEAVPLVGAQNAEREHGTPFDQDPVWVPVDLPVSELPPVPSGKEVALGALAGSNGAVAVTYDGRRKELTPTTSLVGLGVSDAEAGTYKGKADLLPDDPDKGTVEIELKMTTWWGWAALVLVIGIATGIAVQRQVSLKQPLAQLRKRIGELQDRHQKGRDALRAGVGHGGRPWAEFDISDTGALEKGLLKRVEDSGKDVVVKLDEEVLKDLKSKVAAIESQIDLLAEIPEHGEALEAALLSLEQTRPQDLPPLHGASSRQPKPRLATEAEKALAGSLVLAAKLKAKIEAVDTRLAQVGTLQEQEARLGELWVAAKGLDGSADAQKVGELKAALGTVRGQLWTAVGAEDLTAAAAELQKARQGVATLWVGVADDKSLPPEVKSVAIQGVAASVEPAPVKVEEDAAAEPPPAVAVAQTAAPAAPLAESAAGSAASSVPSLPPTPAPKLSEEQTERNLEKARLGQLVVVVLVALVAFSSGMQALYVGKTWGASCWEWLAIFVWGIGVQATVSTLATSLDGLGALGWMRRG